MSEPQGRPARYQRTFSGLLASLLVTVLAIGAFVVFRAAVRDDPDGTPAAVDWQDIVLDAQSGTDRLVHPTTVPSSWKVTSANYRPGRTPADRVWDLGALTEDGRFVGMAQSGTDLEQLASTYVDENAGEGDPVELDSRLGTTWRTFTDSGGDYAVGVALTGALAGQSLLVYGSASPSVVRSYAESLSADPLTQASGSPAAS